MSSFLTHHVPRLQFTFHVLIKVLTVHFSAGVSSLLNCYRFTFHVWFTFPTAGVDGKLSSCYDEAIVNPWMGVVLVFKTSLG